MLNSTDNHLKNIAFAVTGAEIGKNDQLLWQSCKDSSRYSGIPETLEPGEWRQLSAWKTLLTIENKIADGNFFTKDAPENLKLTAEEIKSLKNYCAVVLCNHHGFFNTFKTFLEHGIKGAGWISTGAKARQLYSRIVAIEEKKKIYPTFFDHLFERIHEGSSGRSRLFDLDQDALKTSGEPLRDLAGEKKGIGFINGIVNEFDYAKSSLEYLASLGNVNIRGVYNATHGIFADLKESWYGWWGHSTKPSRKVIKLWDEFFDSHQINGKDDPDAKYLMIGHSQGAIHIKNALKVYDKERRKRIIVLLVAPGVYVNPKYCGDVIHYRTYWDFVTWFDNKNGQRTAKDKIFDLVSNVNAGYIDHPFQSETYKSSIEKHLNNFVNKGTL